MVTKEHLLAELEKIPESRLEAVLDYLQVLKQPTSFTPSEELRSLFEALAQQWCTETRFISSVEQMVLHPAYQQIIGLGEAAIPLLLKELEAKSGHWFWALKSITREDPVPPEDRGRTQAMIEAWLIWGQAKGYTW